MDEDEKRRLESRIRFLESQLQSDRLDLRLYRIGAYVFLLAVTSILMKAFAGVSVPFEIHFAWLAVPASIGVMIMAFLFRRSQIAKIPAPQWRIRSVGTGQYWTGYGWGSTSEAETYGASELQAAVTAAQAHGSVVLTELVVIRTTTLEAAESAPVAVINPT